MEQVSVQQMIDLLDKKVSYLMDFHNLNSEEIHRIQQGNFSNLEAFYYDREILLNAIDRIDSELKGYGSIDQFKDVCSFSKKKVLDLLKSKKQFIHNIVDQDMKIHEKLNTANCEFAEKAKIA